MYMSWCVFCAEWNFVGFSLWNMRNMENKQHRTEIPAIYTLVAHCIERSKNLIFSKSKFIFGLHVCMWAQIHFLHPGIIKIKVNFLLVFKSVTIAHSFIMFFTLEGSDTKVCLGLVALLVWCSLSIRINGRMQLVAAPPNPMPLKHTLVYSFVIYRWLSHLRFVYFTSTNPFI